jgi:hypothetical protein
MHKESILFFFEKLFFPSQCSDFSALWWYMAWWCCMQVPFVMWGRDYLYHGSGCVIRVHLACIAAAMASGLERLRVSTPCQPLNGVLGL